MFIQKTPLLARRGALPPGREGWWVKRK